MLEMGLIVGLGLIVTLLKASSKVKVTILSHPAKADIAVLILLLCLHWGTFSGVMVATIGAFVCSLVLTMGRKIYGYKVGKTYFRGVVDLSGDLGKRTPVATYA